MAGPDAAIFEDLGCTDSKLLSVDRRKAIDRALRAAADVGDPNSSDAVANEQTSVAGTEPSVPPPDAAVRIEVRIIDAEVLDAERRAGATLNEIEIRRFGDIAATLRAPNLFLDAADVDPVRFGEGVLRAAGLDATTCGVRSEHKADMTYPVVGAASIIAKVARDAAVARLARRLERTLALPLGSGYPSDPQTQAFLAEWVRQFKTLPEGTRTTWATAQALLAPKATRLDSFGTA